MREVAAPSQPPPLVTEAPPAPSRRSRRAAMLRCCAAELLVSLVLAPPAHHPPSAAQPTLPLIPPARRYKGGQAGHDWVGHPVPSSRSINVVARMLLLAKSGPATFPPADRPGAQGHCNPALPPSLPPSTLSPPAWRAARASPARGRTDNLQGIPARGPGRARAPAVITGWTILC